MANARRNSSEMAFPILFAQNYVRAAHRSEDHIDEFTSKTGGLKKVYKLVILYIARVLANDRFRRSTNAAP